MLRKGLDIMLLNKVKDEVANSDDLIETLRKEKWVYLTDQEQKSLWPEVCRVYAERVNAKNKSK